MGLSTDGEISFGIVFDEGFEFPWDEYDYDIECNDSNNNRCVSTIIAVLIKRKQK